MKKYIPLFEEFIDENIEKILYHFCNEKKLINILNKNEIKPRWKHFIKDSFHIGTSFTWDTNHSTILNMEYPIKITFDKTKLLEDYKHYFINSNRTYLQTMGMIKANFDPSAYLYEDETPNEIFVVGVIKPLDEYIINIEILKDVSNETKEIIENYLTKFGIST